LLRLTNGKCLMSEYMNEEKKLNFFSSSYDIRINIVFPSIQTFQATPYGCVFWYTYMWIVGDTQARMYNELCWNECPLYSITLVYMLCDIYLYS
jgi:hypothetical protein